MQVGPVGLFSSGAMNRAIFRSIVLVFYDGQIILRKNCQELADDIMTPHPEESLVNASEVFDIPFFSYLGLLGAFN